MGNLFSDIFRGPHKFCTYTQTPDKPYIIVRGLLLMNIAVVGGDLRQCYLAHTLLTNGFGVKIYDVMCESVCGDIVNENSLSNALADCSAVVLPTPVSEKWLCVAKMIPEETIIFGWNIPDGFECFKTYDFGDMEEVALKNAIATAEGTLAEAVKYGSINISGSRCLVLGYGRCGKEIVSRFHSMGAYVTVAARSKYARDDAAFHGMDVCNMFERSEYKKYDFVINTVPARVLGRKEIDKLNEEVVIIDIASVPGGTDFAYCKERNITAVHSLGLPGKYSPKTSGEILGNVIVEVLEKIEN